MYQSAYVALTSWTAGYDEFASGNTKSDRHFLTINIGLLRQRNKTTNLTHWASSTSQFYGIKNTLFPACNSAPVQQASRQLQTQSSWATTIL